MQYSQLSDQLENCIQLTGSSGSQDQEIGIVLSAANKQLVCLMPSVDTTNKSTYTTIVDLTSCTHARTNARTHAHARR